MTDKLIVKGGTTAQWSAATAILASGQVGVDTDLGTMRIGDGSNLWINLPLFVTGALPNVVTRTLTDDLTPATQANFTFTSLVGLTVDTYFEIQMVGITRTASATIYIQTSQNNGSTYFSTSGNYEEARFDAGASVVGTATSIPVLVATTTHSSTNFFIHHLNDSTMETVVRPSGIGWNVTGDNWVMGGRRTAAVAEDAFKIEVASGTFAGRVKIFQYDVITLGV